MQLNFTWEVNVYSSDSPPKFSYLNCSISIKPFWFFESNTKKNLKPIGFMYPRFIYSSVLKKCVAEGLAPSIPWQKASSFGPGLAVTSDKE